jgi:hypothetical protein
LDKVLVITLYRRPEYTQMLFEALRNCYGIEDYMVLISCDYNTEPDIIEDCRLVQDIAKEFAESREAPTHIWVNNPRHGIDLNKMFVIPKAYEISDYMVFLEDDTIPAAEDTLRFFEWVDLTFKDDPNFISASGYNRYLEAETHEFNMRERRYAVDKGTGFCPWGWSMHKDRYERFMGDGKAYAERWGVEVNGRFDWWFTEMIKTHPGCYSIYPVVPRVNHVGGVNAEHTPSPEWLMQNEYAPYGAWTQECPDPNPVIWHPVFDGCFTCGHAKPGENDFSWLCGESYSNVKSVYGEDMKVFHNCMSRGWGKNCTIRIPKEDVAQ